MNQKLAVVPAAVPILALIGGLPFVNRLEPTVLGLPFVLFWMVAWVAAAPVCLAIAYAIVQQHKDDGRGERR